MKKILRILFIEDSEDDALLLLHHIKKGGYRVDYELIQTLVQLKTALLEKEWDLIISDYVMPHFNGLRALTYLTETSLDIPFIVVSGTIGEEVAVNMMKAGANDYLMKDNLMRLLPTIERELRDWESRAERRLLKQKQKQLEEERLSNMRYFESMDKINQTILGTNDLEQLMRDVLKTMMLVFDCDRSWLFYPCDPEATSFIVPMEITKPEYPGAGILNEEVPMPMDMAQNLREALESSDPVTYMAGSEKPINKVSAEQFGVKSMIMVPLYPKTGKPWMLGMHQCSHKRVWTNEDKRLLQETGRRLSDALTGMLIHRDLRKSEAENRAIVDAVPDLLFRVNRDGIITDYRKPEHMGLYVESDQFLGRSIGDVLPVNISDATYPAIEKALKTDEVVTFEYDLHLKEQYQNYEGRMIAFSKDEVMVFVRDITERKQAEQQLIESEQKFRSLAESSPDNIIRYDKECRAIYVNRNMSLTVGSEVVSLIGLTPKESNNFPGTPDYQARLEQAIHSGQSDEIDIVVPDLKGEMRVHQIRIVPEHNNDLEIIGVLAIGRDITDRRLAEKEIARMNRSLRMLSEVNQALIHITDEKALLNEVCRIAVEDGGYRMAWVGFAEHDEAKTIVPVARAGFDSGYIDTLNLTWADVERGHGPCGTAIRTGQPFVVRNVLEEPRFSIWFESAIKQGYQSFIALPLVSGGQTFGLIAIYSAEMEAFDSKEVELLKEMGDDLAFGLIALQIRANREKAEKALRESEERYRLIAENTADTVAVLDLNLNMVYISPSVLKMRGFSVEESLKHSLDQIFTASSMQKVKETFTKQMALEATGKADPMRTETIELEEYCKDGSIIWVEIVVSFLRDANLVPTGILTATRNITERKLTEDKLRILSRAVEQSPASIIITNTDGTIEYVNPKFMSVTGYSIDEVLGQNPRILKSSEQGPQYYEQFWKTITSGKEWYGEFHNKKKNGELFWELASISPIFDTDGEITHYLAVKEDITSRKNTEQELISAKLKAEE
ncbi:MAG: PAS domain S-box protein, partial [Candidatus Paceibacterota bacterium]